LNFSGTILNIRQLKDYHSPLVDTEKNMARPKSPRWNVIFSEGDEIDLRRMQIQAKSPKVAVRAFMRDFPQYKFLGMGVPGALPLIGDIPEMLPTGRVKRRHVT
jgi:hypothetical protein